MKNWFFKNLGDAMLAYEQQDQIKELFLSEYANAGNLKEIAVFLRHESEGRLHCEVMVYFSPLAKSVALKVNAEPCDKPSFNDLSILAGSHDAWQTLFPERTL